MHTNTPTPEERPPSLVRGTIWEKSSCLIETVVLQISRFGGKHNPVIIHFLQNIYIKHKFIGKHIYFPAAETAVSVFTLAPPAFVSCLVVSNRMKTLEVFTASCGFKHVRERRRLRFTEFMSAVLHSLMLLFTHWYVSESCFLRSYCVGLISWKINCLKLIGKTV